MSTSSLLERRRRVMGDRAPLFYRRPLQLVRGEGVWVFDADGHRYLDAYNNVPHVGHCHPDVVAALARQAGTLNTHTRYLDEQVVTYSERLVQTFDPSLSNVVLVCTGSEANELALRIAREVTGRRGVICTDFSYHGNTTAVAEISTLLTGPDRRPDHVRTVPVMDPYRERHGRDDGALIEQYADDVQRAVDELRTSGAGLAAMLVCTAFSNEGLPLVPAGYLERAARIVHDAGGVLIADEVQGGFGRFGTHLWGHAALGAVPDIVTLGKPMGNGHPLAGVVTRPELLEEFTSRQMYFNTFGGNPVSAAVGMAVLDIIERDDLMANARRTGAYVLERLGRLQETHELVGDVRGKGMFFAVELVVDRETKEPAAAQTRLVVEGMRDRGVLISSIGPHDNILKIRPPMPFGSAHADLLVDAMDDVLCGL